MRVEFTVHEDWADLLVEAHQSYFRQEGFEPALSLSQVEGESIYQFSDGDTIVVLEDKKIGDDQRTLALSSKSKTLDVEALQIGAFCLFADAVHDVLMHAIASEEGKKKLKSCLNRTLQGTEKKL